MIDFKALQRALIVGTLLQVTLAVLGHYSPWLAANAFWFGGMMISATASYLYAQDIGPGHVRGAIVGAFIGGGCAAIGFEVSVVLGDVTPHEYWLRTGVSIVTGAVGGPFGQMSYRLRNLDWR